MESALLTLLILTLGATHLASAQCSTSKYCAYTYNNNNNNCTINTWDCINECFANDSCNPGTSCVNSLCCHADQLTNGSADCPTTDDLEACDGYVRTIGPGSAAAWVPPHTEIPEELNCGC
ncbi:hypothetical protein QBC36DRAFT_347833 [Triangularia setosa]|uniref:Uncharacterized protein n=1 Tax=Triangularia setosa TaxID=2587417 RepID=A0AAN7A5A4_9PEZI|nr:hypothetical protein QBC36DRAFT_347833 [Podospora setosa]